MFPVRDRAEPAIDRRGQILADDCIELRELIVEHPPVVIRKSRAIESRW